MFLAAIGEEVLRDVEVLWPSGYLQRVGDLAAGQRHELIEPALITLEPGLYTVKVSGVDGTIGLSLVEIYEVVQP